MRCLSVFEGCQLLYRADRHTFTAQPALLHRQQDYAYDDADQTEQTKVCRYGHSVQYRHLSLLAHNSTDCSEQKLLNLR